MKRIPVVESKGKRYGRLFVLNIVYKHNSRIPYAKCRCDCDKHLPKEKRKIVYPQIGHLRNGSTRSCGCWNKEAVTKRNTTHGAKQKGLIVEYHAHYRMLLQCYDKTHPHFKNWGGRGIRVCKQWRGEKGTENFLKFVEEKLGRRPGPGYSIDRIKNDGNYEPGNIKWSTAKEQANNRRVYPKHRKKRIKA